MMTKSMTITLLGMQKNKFVSYFAIYYRNYYYIYIFIYFQVSGEHEHLTAIVTWKSSEQAAELLHSLPKTQEHVDKLERKNKAEAREEAKQREKKQFLIKYGFVPSDDQVEHLLQYCFVPSEDEDEEQDEDDDVDDD